jgi:hypothetical protein
MRKILVIIFLLTTIILKVSAQNYPYTKDSILFVNESIPLPNNLQFIDDIKVKYNHFKIPDSIVQMQIQQLITIAKFKKANVIQVLKGNGRGGNFIDITRIKANLFYCSNLDSLSLLVANNDKANKFYTNLNTSKKYIILYRPTNFTCITCDQALAYFEFENKHYELKLGEVLALEINTKLQSVEVIFPRDLNMTSQKIYIGNDRFYFIKTFALPNPSNARPGVNIPIGKMNTTHYFFEEDIYPLLEVQKILNRVE